MVIYSMSVSADGFITDRDGDFAWSVPGADTFRFHLEEVGKLGACVLGRRLYETMVVWETDPSLRDDADSTAFAEVWTALPKIVFSRTLENVEGNARLATGSLDRELAAAVAAGGGPVEVGGAGLAASAIELDLVDEFRMFRYPVVVGGGTPFLPPVTAHLPLELVETRTFEDRVVLERYRRAR